MNNKQTSTPDRLHGGVSSIFSSLPDRYIYRGSGGYCWDQKNKKYIDFVCGYGSIILGHCNPEVDLAVVKQIKHGMMFPSNSPLHTKLSLSLKEIFPYTDRSLFLKTGSEAISAAIRLARAFTGKTKIIYCGFHGWHDSVVSPSISWHLYEPDPLPPRPVAGIPKINAKPLVFHWTGENLQQLKNLFRENSPDVAAFILDPVQIREPLKEHIEQIETIVRNEKALFIMDETKTGFRVSLTGVQGLYGIKPDLTILGKGMSNGFPLSTVIGPEKIINLSKNTKIMGTYNSELLSISAALKTISILRKPTTVDHLWQTGQYLIDGINKILSKYKLNNDIQAVAYRWPCMPFIWFHNNSKKARLIKPIFYDRLVKHGVLLLPDHMSFTCLVHTTKDVEKTLQIIDDTYKKCLFEKDKSL